MKEKGVEACSPGPLSVSSRKGRYSACNETAHVVSAFKHLVTISEAV